jgi:hypothetical protein
VRKYVLVQGDTLLAPVALVGGLIRGNRAAVTLSEVPLHLTQRDETDNLYCCHLHPFGVAARHLLTIPRIRPR